MTALRSILLLLTPLLLAACASSKILAPQAPVLAAEGEPAAVVYFIRPRASRSHGVADDPVRIYIDKTLVLTLAEGEYLRLRLRPGQREIELRNLSYMTAKPEPIEVWRSGVFTFAPGQTYYLEAQLDDQEFRGIYFVPRLIDLHRAHRLVREHALRPASEETRRHPIR